MGPAGTGDSGGPPGSSFLPGRVHRAPQDRRRGLGAQGSAPPRILPCSRSWAVCGPAPAICPASEACLVAPQVQAPSAAFTGCTWSVGPTYSSGCLRGQGSQTPPLSSLNLGPVQGCPSQAVCVGPFHMSPRGLWSDQASLWALLSAPSGWPLAAVALMESWAAREADPKWTGGLWGPPVTWAAPPPRAPASGRKTRVCPLTVQQPCQSHPPGAGPESEATAALGHGQGRRGPPSGCGGAPPSSGGPSAGAGSMLLSGELPRCMLSSAEPTSPAELRGWGGVLAFPILLPGPPATSLPTCPPRLPLPTLC